MIIVPPKIAVTLVKPSLEYVLSGIEDATEILADYIEIRADAIENLKVEDLAEIYGHSSIPLVFTLRHRAEAGLSSKFGFKGTEEERLKFYLKAAELGFPLLDIEDEHFLEYNKCRSKLLDMIKTLSHGRSKVISSWHDWEGTPDPDELVARFHIMADYNPPIIKMATKANRYEDNTNMLHLADWARENYNHIELLLMTFGKLCGETRVFGHQHGNKYTYVALKEEEAAAPGQMSAERIRRAWKELKIIK